MIKIILTITLLLLPFSAMAQENTQTPPPAPVIMETPHKLGSTKYSPDYCEFTADFPEEPIVNNYCEDPEDESTCYNLISYTKVLEMASTVNIEIICNPSTPEMYAEFIPEVMKETVNAMTKDSVIEKYNVKTRQADTYRQTGLIGKGKKGLNETIYLAQLWVSEKSIMSVKAEMSGAQTKEADALFADILQTIGYAKEINQDQQSEEPKEP